MKKENFAPVADSSGRIISGLHKSLDTGAIVAEKNAEYQRYLRERENMKHVKNLTDEVDTLKTEIHELKSLLKEKLNYEDNK